MTSLIEWQWRALSESTSHQTNAAYAVRLLDKRGVVSIPRFLGNDSEGLLTIGMSTNLERRRRGFIRGLTKGRGHSSANILFFLRTEAHQSVIEGARYEISFCPAATRDDALQMESRLTRSYLARFGEAPPLTSVIPNRYEHLHKG